MELTTTRLSATQRWTLVVASLAVTLVIASMAALYTALPEIAGATGSTQKELTWIIDGYTLALACLVLPAGALGDRYGRRVVLIVGLCVFAAASSVPLLVNDPTWLIGTRALAGAGAAFVMPSTLSLLTASFPEERRGGAIGLWAGMAGAGAILGIIGSGLLLEYWSWTSIFLGMSLAGLALLAAAFTVPESVDEQRPALDLWGSAAVAAAVGLVVVAAIEAPTRGWLSPVVLGGFLGGAVAAGLFVWIESRVAHPLLDIKLFAERGFGSGTMVVTIQFMVSFGSFMVIVQFLQLILGYRPLISAVVLAPMMVPMVLIAVFIPRFAERFGPRLPMSIGLAVIGISFLTLARLDIHSTYFDLLWSLLIMSAGVGLCTSPATAAIVTGTPVEKHGVAAAVNDAAREIGAAIGIAVAGSILAAGYSHRIAPALPLVPEAARGPVGDSLAATLEITGRIGPAGDQLAELAKISFLHGAGQAAIALGICALAAAAVVAFWAPGRRREPDASAKSDASQVDSAKAPVPN
ncbi:MFS transporter [Nocardia callitridis]|uniref:MFS transporter n=1 Tax=Nocardia callitridis TaxID=648753 RepID=A0ABP9KBZ6_9NOCA